MGKYLPNVLDGTDTYIIREPLGVCAGICPLNFPALVPLWVCLLLYFIISFVLPLHALCTYMGQYWFLLVHKRGNHYSVFTNLQIFSTFFTCDHCLLSVELLLATLFFWFLRDFSALSEIWNPDSHTDVPNRCDMWQYVYTEAIRERYR